MMGKFSFFSKLVHLQSLFGDNDQNGEQMLFWKSYDVKPKRDLYLFQNLIGKRRQNKRSCQAKMRLDIMQRLDNKICCLYTKTTFMCCQGKGYALHFIFSQIATDVFMKLLRQLHRLCQV